MNTEKQDIGMRERYKPYVQGKKPAKPRESIEFPRWKWTEEKEAQQKKSLSKWKKLLPCLKIKNQNSLM